MFALHEILTEKKKCQLHYYGFGRRTQGGGYGYNGALAISPSLYSYGLSKTDMMEPAAWNLVVHQAPGLKRKSVILPSMDPIPLGQFNEDDEDDDQNENQDEDDNYTLLSGYHKSKPVPLKYLQFKRVGSPGILQSFKLSSWAADVDFSALHVLKLEVAVRPNMLPEPSMFPALVTLFFKCAKDAYNYSSVSYSETVRSFLRQLPQLTTLQLLHM
ncbi:hypothetical protein SLS53_003872 [Cytospora paraplurivora]|uniref:Uncharacterized protein n=1 Tax=Cytospora paraplurivora TaxID=2898453 RepID=A0AAN9YGG3_9PEZI